MTVKVGRIAELKGEGLELLVDEETQSQVIARFFDGKLIASLEANVQSDFVETESEATLAL